MLLKYFLHLLPTASRSEVFHNSEVVTNVLQWSQCCQATAKHVHVEDTKAT